MTQSEFMEKAEPITIRLGDELDCEPMELKARRKLCGSRLGWKGSYNTTVMVNGEELPVRVVCTVQATESSHWPLGRVKICKATARMILSMNSKANMEQFDIGDE